MVNFQSTLTTGLVGVGGACVLAKGWLDLKNPQANQKLAKAEIIGGCVSLTFTALKICLSLNDFFSSERFILINEKDILDGKLAIVKTSTFFENVLDKFATAGCALLLFSLTHKFSCLQKFVWRN